MTEDRTLTQTQTYLSTFTDTMTATQTQTETATATVTETSLASCLSQVGIQSFSALYVVGTNINSRSARAHGPCRWVTATHTTLTRRQRHRTPCPPLLRMLLQRRPLPALAMATTETVVMAPADTAPAATAQATKLAMATARKT